jgi:small subunit ribosomal protein S21
VGLKIEVKNNNVEKAMRILKKKLLKEGVMRLYKMKQTYEKPSEKRVRKSKEMRANFLKRQKMLRDIRGY